MATNDPKFHTLFLVPDRKHQSRKFSEVQGELEDAFARLRECRETRQRAEMLRRMRVLLEEADRAVMSSKNDLKPELKVLTRSRS